MYREDLIDPEQRTVDAPPEGKGYLCRACRREITRGDAAVEVNGAHAHTFANPAGILFEIGCFSAAPGAAVRGAPTTEFTWFPGHAWRYGLCSGCGAHLGWHFSGPGGAAFFGLILARLVEGP